MILKSRLTKNVFFYREWNRKKVKFVSNFNTMIDQLYQNQNLNFFKI